MLTIGLIASGIFLFSLAATAVTSRPRWFLAGLWAIPIIGMAFGTKENTQINGLLVVVCFFMFYIYTSSLKGVLMWNVKKRKSVLILEAIVFLLIFAVLAYVVAQAQMLHYIPDFMELNTPELNYGRIVLFSIPLLLLCIPYSTMIVTFLDKFFSRKMTLVLLECKTFKGSEYGGDKSFWTCYFLVGICNGIEYHFKMTARTFIMIKKEETLALKLRKGFLGGFYVMENPCPQNERRTLRRDRRQLKTGIALVLLTILIAAGHYLYVRFM